MNPGPAVAAPFCSCGFSNVFLRPPHRRLVQGSNRLPGQLRGAQFIVFYPSPLSSLGLTSVSTNWHPFLHPMAATDIPEVSTPSRCLLHSTTDHSKREHSGIGDALPSPSQVSSQASASEPVLRSATSSALVTTADIPTHKHIASRGTVLERMLTVSQT